MGKSKKRNFNKNTENKGAVYKRSEAVLSVVSDIRNNAITGNTRLQINLFGITEEELTEAGATLEEVSLVRNLFL